MVVRGLLATSPAAEFRVPSLSRERLLLQGIGGRAADK